MPLVDTSQAGVNFNERSMSTGELRLWNGGKECYDPKYHTKL